MLPADVPRMVMQKPVEIRIFDRAAHSLCNDHQGSFDILNTLSKISPGNFETQTFRRRQ